MCVFPLLSLSPLPSSSGKVSWEKEKLVRQVEGGGSGNTKNIFGLSALSEKRKQNKNLWAYFTPF